MCTPLFGMCIYSASFHVEGGSQGESTRRSPTLLSPPAGQNKCDLTVNDMIKQDALSRPVEILFPCSCTPANQPSTLQCGVIRHRLQQKITGRRGCSHRAPGAAAAAAGGRRSRSSVTMSGLRSANKIYISSVEPTQELA